MMSGGATVVKIEFVDKVSVWISSDCIAVEIDISPMRGKGSSAKGSA